MLLTYLGPAGTFTEAALRATPEAGAPDAVLRPEPTVIAALDAVRSGEAAGALVPFENSVEGAVPSTLDELASGSPLQIRREILLPDNGLPQNQDARPIRSETRATLVAAIARGRAWLNEMAEDPKATTENIASRERCSPRKINKTISLAFLAPELVKAAIEGRLPHRMGVARLFDLPAEWSRQRQVLGLSAQ